MISSIIFLTTLGLLTEYAFGKTLLPSQPTNTSDIVDVQLYNNEINSRIINNHKHYVRRKVTSWKTRDDSNYALLELFAFRAILCSKFVQSKIHSARDLFDNYICKPILKNKFKRLYEWKDKVKEIFQRKIANVQQELNHSVDSDVQRKRVRHFSRTVETERRREHAVTDKDAPSSSDWESEQRPGNLLDGMDRHSHWDPYAPDKFR